MYLIVFSILLGSMEHCRCGSTASLVFSHLRVPWVGDLEPVYCLTSDLDSRRAQVFPSHVIAAVYVYTLRCRALLSVALDVCVCAVEYRWGFCRFNSYRCHARTNMPSDCHDSIDYITTASNGRQEN